MAKKQKRIPKVERRPLFIIAGLPKEICNTVIEGLTQDTALPLTKYIAEPSPAGEYFDLYNTRTIEGLLRSTGEFVVSNLPKGSSDKRIVPSAQTHSEGACR